jgi:hypothetical protein
LCLEEFLGEKMIGMIGKIIRGGTKIPLALIRTSTTFVIKELLSAAVKAPI